MTTENDLQNAENEILAKALVNNNAIYVLEIGGDIQVQIGAERYAASLRQRLTFLAAVESLERALFVNQISNELFELTYQGWVEACRRNNQQPEFGDGAVERAEQSLMIGAYEGNNAIYLSSQNGELVVSAAGYAYNDSQEQRLLYIYALECLMKQGFARFIENQLYELTYTGHLKALDLSEEGIQQDKSNP